MARPSTVFSWAASAPSGYVVAVPSAIRASGFLPNGVVSHPYINDALQDVADWIAYLAAFAPQDEELDVGRITGTGDPSSSEGLYITTDGSDGTGITIAPTTNGVLQLTTAGAGGIGLTSAGVINAVSAGALSLRATAGDALLASGATGQNRITIDHPTGTIAVLSVDGDVTVNGENVYVTSSAGDLGLEATTGRVYTATTHHLDAGARAFRNASPNGVRYAYGDGAGAASYLPIATEVSPLHGGYSFRFAAAPVPISVGWVDVGSGYAQTWNASGGAVSVWAVRPLPLVVANAEAGSTVYRAASLAAEWDAGAGATKLTLYKRTKGTATWTAVLVSTPASPTDTNGGTPVVLTPGTHDYAVVFEHAGLANGSGTVGIRDATLTVHKYAVE